MKLTSMKRTPEERKADAQPSAVDMPDYPWGLQITLSEEDLVQLGISDIPTAGAPVALEGIAKVTSTSSSEVDGKPNRSVTLQITDLAVAIPGSGTADRMYPTRSKG